MEEFSYTLNITDATYPGLSTSITTSASALEAAQGAHAIAVLTEWDEFVGYDYAALFAVMSKPAFIFDGRNILPHDELRAIGFEVYAVGKPMIKKF